VLDVDEIWHKIHGYVEKKVRQLIIGGETLETGCGQCALEFPFVLDVDEIWRKILGYVEPPLNFGARHGHLGAYHRW
jgi:hypothetical protein